MEAGGRVGLGAAVLAGAVLAASGAPAAPAPSLSAKLVAAAKATPVRDIDYDDDRCDERSVAQWLSDLAGRKARSVAWTAGRCQIVGPGIDAGGQYCVQATVTLAKPKSHSDRPMVEIFFESPSHGRPGKAYAFRGLMVAADGLDMSRFRRDFESDWISRFPAAKRAVVACDGG